MHSDNPKSPPRAAPPPPDGPHISGLGAIMAASRAGKGPLPVEKWNPPHCGDIGMEIRADGTWFYQNSPIGRQPMVKLFASILRHDADGQHYLVTPVEKVLVAVADAPFMAVEMEVRGAGEDQILMFRTNVDDIVVVGPDHPMRFVEQAETGGLKPYILVRGRLEALLTRAVYIDLANIAVQSPDNGAAQDTYGVWSSGIFFPLRAS